MEEKLEQKNEALQYFKAKSVKLEKSLENTKIFLNMVIHDLRNPTNQVEYLVNQSVKKLKVIQQKFSKLRDKFKVEKKVSLSDVSEYAPAELASVFEIKMS